MKKETKKSNPKAKPADPKAKATELSEENLDKVSGGTSNLNLSKSNIN